jgi:hypothetical protein
VKGGFSHVSGTTVLDHTHLWSTEDDDGPPGFEDWLTLTSSLLNEPDDTQSPMKRSSHILIEIRKIVAHNPNLVAITSKKGSKFLVIHAAVDSPFADLETVHMNDGQNSS